MQTFIGFLVLGAVLAGATTLSYNFAANEKKFVRKVIVLPLFFIGFVLAIYAGLGAIGVFLWLVAWIGIILRQILMWLIEAILIPYHWLLDFLF